MLYLVSVQFRFRWAERACFECYYGYGIYSFEQKKPNYKMYMYVQYLIYMYHYLLIIFIIIINY